MTRCKDHQKMMKARDALNLARPNPIFPRVHGFGSARGMGGFERPETITLLKRSEVAQLLHVDECMVADDMHSLSTAHVLPQLLQCSKYMRGMAGSISRQGSWLVKGAILRQS